ncbi:hypothetical protein HOV93_03320 [Planctomycetes bacterium FF15]|uniref:Uncharacterized protein n=1 Tax=Bremerella alba TaxID=980252 RepID=A0A7V8V206_9BACT|nr:hypothetical protein [Bremerella alba]
MVGTAMDQALALTFGLVVGRSQLQGCMRYGSGLTARTVVMLPP